MHRGRVSGAEVALHLGRLGLIVFQGEHADPDRDHGEDYGTEEDPDCRAHVLRVQGWGSESAFGKPGAEFPNALLEPKC
jgi:hypothetical protein